MDEYVRVCLRVMHVNERSIGMCKEEGNEEKEDYDIIVN